MSNNYHKSCAGNIVSHEHLQLSQNFTVNIVCYFSDTTTIDSLIWKLPTGWSIVNSNPNNLVGMPDDSLLLSFTMSIPNISTLPFYPQDIEMKLLTNKQNNNFQITSLNIKNNYSHEKV